MDAAAHLDDDFTKCKIVVALAQSHNLPPLLPKMASKVLPLPLKNCNTPKAFQLIVVTPCYSFSSMLSFFLVKYFLLSVASALIFLSPFQLVVSRISSRSFSNSLIKMIQ